MLLEGAPCEIQEKNLPHVLHEHKHSLSIVVTKSLWRSSYFILPREQIFCSLKLDYDEYVDFVTSILVNDNLSDGVNMASNHWDKIYSEKQNDEMSWFQEIPQKSLDLIREFNLRFDSKIIDIGAGDSRLVDALFDLGFHDLTVLDISIEALKKTKTRLALSHRQVKLIESDVTQFKAPEKYKLWHDRATFHFLTKKEDIEAYVKIAFESLDQDGHLIVSTFSKTGPEKCSGLEISQYSDSDLKSIFGKYFKNIKCIEDTHETPWGSKQDFVYCGFKKAIL